MSVVIWLADAEILQGLQASRPMARAIVMTYWIRTSYVGMLLPLGIWGLSRRLCRADNRSVDFIKFLPSWSFLKCATGLNVMVFLCEVFWYNSLNETTVSINTAIYNSLPIFVLLLSAALLGEKITMRKSISVLLGIVGLVVITISNSGQGKSSMTGIILVLISTFLFAIYSVMSKRWNEVFFLDTSSGNKIDSVDPKESSIIQIATCLKLVSVMGVINLLTMWPLMYVAQFLHLDSMDMSLWDIGIYSLIGFSGALYALFALLAILLVTPLFVSIGTLLTIPLSILFDLWLHHFLPPPLSYVGIVLVCAAFVILATGNDGIPAGH